MFVFLEEHLPCSSQDLKLRSNLNIFSKLDLAIGLLLLSVLNDKSLANKTVCPNHLSTFFFAYLSCKLHWELAEMFTQIKGGEQNAMNESEYV